MCCVCAFFCFLFFYILFLEPLKCWKWNGREWCLSLAWSEEILSASGGVQSPEPPSREVALWPHQGGGGGGGVASLQALSVLLSPISDYIYNAQIPPPEEDLSSRNIGNLKLFVLFSPVAYISIYINMHNSVVVSIKYKAKAPRGLVRQLKLFSKNKKVSKLSLNIWSLSEVACL